MAFAIRRNLHFCRFGSSVVFLDLERDRYFLLRDKAAARFTEFLAGDADSGDLEWLVGQAIIAENSAEDAFARSHIERPESSLVDDPVCSASPFLIAEAIATQLIARRLIRRKPLLKTVRLCASRRNAATALDQGVYADVAAAFNTANRFISATDQCLSRGIAAMGMLTRRNCQASFVIGVAMPFSAHCWVQHGATVLTDSLDRVRSFKPILVV